MAQRGRPRKPREMVTCRECGKQFEAIVTEHRKFCSRECYGRYGIDLVSRPRLYVRVCEWCGQTYSTEAPRTSYCCRECARLADLKKGRKEWESTTCVMCGKPNEPPRTKFCSDTCSNRYRKSIRRARKRESFVEPVTVAALVERDGEVCGICGESLDLSLTYPHPKSVTLDHITPLVRGGLHSLLNCQLAHFRCNSAKGAR